MAELLQEGNMVKLDKLPQYVNAYEREWAVSVLREYGGKTWQVLYALYRYHSPEDDHRHIECRTLIWSPYFSWPGLREYLSGEDFSGDVREVLPVYISGAGAQEKLSGTWHKWTIVNADSFILPEHLWKN